MKSTVETDWIRLAARGLVFSPSMVGAGMCGEKTETRRLAVTQGATGRRNWLCDCVPGDLLYVRESVKWWRGPSQIAMEGDFLHGRYRAALAECPAGFDEPPGLSDAVAQLGMRDTFVCDPLVPGPIHAGSRSMDDPQRPCVWTPRELNRWQQPRAMPLFANRFTLRVTGVRTEPVDAISEADALAEGIVTRGPAPDPKDAPGPLYAEWGAWRREGPPGPDGLAQWCVDDTLKSFDPVMAYARLWNRLHDRDGVRFEDGPEVVVISFEWINRPVWAVEGAAPAKLLKFQDKVEG